MNNINHRVSVNTMLILSIKLFDSRTRYKHLRINYKSLQSNHISEIESLKNPKRYYPNKQNLQLREKVKLSEHLEGKYWKLY